MSQELEAAGQPAEAEALVGHGSAGRTARFCALATMGGCIFGYSTGVLSGVLPFVARPQAAGGLGLTATGQGVLSSSLILGAAFGSMIGGRLADGLGRRKLLLMLSAVFLVGTLGAAFGDPLAVMLAFRVILGFSVGAGSATVPTYIAEMAPMRYRAGMVTWNELAIVTGQLLSFIVNAIVANLWGGTTMLAGQPLWRYCLALGVIPAIVLGVAMSRAPETPRWYASRGRLDEARATLQATRSGSVAAEYEDISRTAAGSGASSGTLKELANPRIRRLTLMEIGLGVTIMITGINAVMGFAPSILMSTGLGANASVTVTVANGVVSVAMTALAMKLVNVFPRRTYYLTGIGIVMVAIATLGVLGLLPGQSTGLSIVIALMILVMLVGQQLAVSPLTYVYMAEIFPMRCRGLGMGIGMTSFWIVNFLVNLLFPVLLSKFGTASFFIFLAGTLVMFLINAKVLPETKGKSLEELEEILA